MRRGTTPTHTFTLPFEVSLISKLRINYAQNGVLVLVKTESDATLEGRTVSVQLSQEDTLAFKCTRGVDIQLDVLTMGGDLLKTKIMQTSVARCLNSEVLE